VYPQDRSFFRCSKSSMKEEPIRGPRRDERVFKVMSRCRSTQICLNVTWTCLMAMALRPRSFVSSAGSRRHSVYAGRGFAVPSYTSS
jgi:hypothetical protein